MKRRKLDGSHEDVYCPTLLVDYQQYMTGVDVGDQMMGYIKHCKEEQKWWKRVFFYILECSILNSYVIDVHVHSAEHLAREA